MSLVEFGHFCLILALVVALAQTIVPLVGAHTGDRRLMLLGDQAALVQALCLTLSFGALTYAFVQSDFTVALVRNNSHTLKPLLYKISGVWGNHEGSMLLWVWVLALFGALVAATARSLPPTFKARALAVQGLLGLCFLGFVLFTSNPFLRLFPAALEGQDLNPLLQDPGLAFHPPLLYGGYVGLSMTFSLAVAALLEGRVDSGWARWLRPWALLAWAMLTAGIALGSWWAYYELGWGGFWFWDPVENASFIPWLMATALLHSAIVVEKRDNLKIWTVLLSILAFAMVMVGTFIVRSGVITSVHAFAVDPDRGVVILGLLAFLVGGALVLFAWRAPQLQPGGLFKPVSREGALLLNNLLMTTAAVTIALGTLYPMFADILAGEKISVGAPFFNATFVPLMTPLMAALAIAPLLAWKRGDLAGMYQQIAVMLAVTVGVVGLVALVRGGSSAQALLGVALGAWLIAGVFLEIAKRIGLGRIALADSARRLLSLPRSAWGMSLAHFGVGLTILGITGGSLWGSELLQRVQVGETIQKGPYTVVLEDVSRVPGPNYLAERAIVTVRRDGDLIARLAPENRRYVASGQSTTEAAILVTLLRDYYVVLGDGDAQRGYSVSVKVKPLVAWMWLGTTIMVVAGFLSLADRRLRIAVGKRSAAPRAAAEPEPKPEAVATG